VVYDEKNRLPLSFASDFQIKNERTSPFDHYDLA